MSGPFGSSQWMYNAGGGFYDFPISNSLRFEDGDTASLSRTPSSASNRKTWTWSGWVKRGNLTGVRQVFFGGGTTQNDTNWLEFGWETDNKFYCTTNLAAVRSAALFRDTGSWYHIVFVADTTQSTATNRFKLYVNGVDQSIGNLTSVGQNADTGVNYTEAHKIGNSPATTNRDLDSYIAEVNFIDGTALTPSSFGETKNDIWIPKNTSGLTFGTNGFRLEFKQSGTGTASSTTIGADTSGNDNHWTSSGLAVSDQMPDSPTNNYCTLNPLDKDGHTNSEGNLKVSGNVIYGHEKSTFAVTSGKWYFEAALTVQQNDTAIGLANQSASTLDHFSGQTTDSVGYLSDGRFFYNGSSTSYSSWTTSDVAQIAFDADTGEIWIGKNNTYQNSGDPANGTGEVVTVSWNEFIPAARTIGSGAMCFNFGQDSSFAGAKTAQGNTDGNGIGDFYYAPPTGFLALCTANLPEPVIGPNSTETSDQNFNTVLYTGNSSTNAITDVGFQPDLVWIKARTLAFHHRLLDSVRGVTSLLYSNLTSAEDTIPNANDSFTSFDSNGFTLGVGQGINHSGSTFVAWNWKAGTAFSNDASATGVGTIDSTGSVNTDAGFSIVSYTGNGSSGATIGHGLGVAPKMMIVKLRSGTNSWAVYHASIGTNYMLLNSTLASTSASAIWNASPSSTTFTVGNDLIVNTNGGTYVGYMFSEIAGYSKFGGYTGNGSTDGPFVYTGFRPAFVMIKRTNLARNWVMFDDARDPFNEMKLSLEANVSDAQYTNTNAIDFVSNGFKPRVNTPSWNASGGTYIYMAFAEQPFKYANAR